MRGWKGGPGGPDGRENSTVTCTVCHMYVSVHKEKKERQMVAEMLFYEPIEM